MTQAADATRTLVMERVLAHPPEKVWRALTTAQAAANGTGSTS